MAKTEFGRLSPNRSEDADFNHHEDRRPALAAGFVEVTLPTQYPSVALGDLMMHTRRVPTRADKDEVQDIGPRLSQDGVGDRAAPRVFKNYKITAYDEGEREVLIDPQYEDQYCDQSREQEVEEPIKDEP